ncbi:ring-cleaving dioxygenase, partial [Enterococcus faecalis]
AIQLRVQYAVATKQPLMYYLHWHEKETVPFFETAHEVTVLENHHPQFYQEAHIIDDRTNRLAIEGIGGVHHVAFGVEDTQELT